MKITSLFLNTQKFPLLPVRSPKFIKYIAEIYICVDDTILIQFPDQSSKPHMKHMWLNQTLYYEVLREFGILCQSLIVTRGKNRNIFLSYCHLL